MAESTKVNGFEVNPGAGEERKREAKEGKGNERSGRKRRAMGGEDHEAKMRSVEFLEASEEQKFGLIGQVLNGLQEHQKKTDKLLSDVSHQYSKYCLVMSGKALPQETANEDTVGIWRDGMLLKYGIAIKEEERSQFRSCHRVDGGALVAAFTTTIKGSVFDRCAFRGTRDGKTANWKGELAPPPGGVSMNLSVDRTASVVDRPIKSISLFLKRQDKDKPKLEKRVEQVKITPGGFVAFRNGRGEMKRIYHESEARRLMTEEEKKIFVGFSNHSKERGKQGGRREKAGRGARGAQVEKMQE